MNEIYRPVKVPNLKIGILVALAFMYGSVKALPLELARKRHLLHPNSQPLLSIVSQLLENDRRLQTTLRGFTYHQSFSVTETREDGSVLGRHYQEWDISFDDNGQEVAMEAAAAQDTLRTAKIPTQISNKLAHIQPLLFLPKDANDYIFKYLNHIMLRSISVYELAVRPKKIKAGKFYFSGIIWVGDENFQMIKAEGKEVPEVPTQNGRLLFPKFITYRSIANGGIWLPEFTSGVLFVHGVKLTILIRYYEYKKFESETKLIIRNQ